MGKLHHQGSSRPRNVGGTIEERGRPDLENNFKGGGDRGDPPRAIVIAGDTGKGKALGKKWKTAK